MAADGGRRRPGVAADLAPLGDRVRLLGAVDGAALPDIYAAADLLVWPAVDEAYGMALLEAQAAGLPVVAGAAGGVPTIVRDGVTGLLARPGDADGFAAAVRSLVRDPARRRDMAEAAARIARAEHDIATARDRIDDLLREVRARCRC